MKIEKGKWYLCSNYQWNCYDSGKKYYCEKDGCLTNEKGNLVELNRADIKYFTETTEPNEQPKRGDMVIIDSDVVELRMIRNYFGEHDVTGFEHFAYAVLDGIIKRAEPKPLKVSMSEALSILKAHKGVDCVIEG